MKKKLVVLALILGLGAMSYSAFHMIYEKYPVIGHGVMRTMPLPSLLTLKWANSPGCMKTFTGRMANMMRTSKEPI